VKLIDPEAAAVSRYSFEDADELVDCIHDSIDALYAPWWRKLWWRFSPRRGSLRWALRQAKRRQP